MDWICNNNAKFYHYGKHGVDYYNHQTLTRKEKYPFDNKGLYKKNVDSLKSNGYTIFKNVISHDLIDSILDKASYCIKTKQNLKSHDNHYSAINQPYLQSDECFN